MERNGRAMIVDSTANQLSMTKFTLSMEWSRVHKMSMCSAISRSITRCTFILLRFIFFMCASFAPFISYTKLSTCSLLLECTWVWEWLCIVILWHHTHVFFLWMTYILHWTLTLYVHYQVSIPIGSAVWYTISRNTFKKWCPIDCNYE